MVFAIAWYAGSDDENEQDGKGFMDERSFADLEQAKEFAWERMEEGFVVRLWRR